MNRDERILQALRSLSPKHVDLKNESGKHAHHIAMQTEVKATGETHYKLIIVSEQFEGLSALERQRRVNTLVAEEFKTGLHALQIKTLTPKEFEKKSISQ